MGVFKESDYFLSEEFKNDFRKRVEDDTWGRGLPMICTDEKGDLVKHWKDGRVEIVKTKEELTESWKLIIDKFNVGKNN
jgi:hypothetical protein